MTQTENPVYRRAENPDMEVRYVEPLEVRAAPNDQGQDTLTGYVFEWDKPSKDLGGFSEIIRRGAAAGPLAGEPNIFAILDHEMTVCNLLGDRDSGTLQLFEDDRGLAFVIFPPATQAGRDAVTVAKRSKIGMSFSFICGEQRWSVQGGQRVREVLSLREMQEISLVVDPAYRSSNVEAARRSMQAAEAAELAATAVAEQPAPEAIQQPTGPSVDYLRRQLDLAELSLALDLERT